MTRQEEIKYLLHTFGIKQNWLAEKLGINNQTLTYLLNDAPLIDDDLYNKVKTILDDYQFDLALFDEEKPKETRKNPRWNIHDPQIFVCGRQLEHS